ncbi:beta strand repeat-containing protein [Cryptobacterium curtum]|uniref:beta strand repeat-containing protein n=1 Tax=Cryptobacterium curtum TaxID=84163 RepID=UPI00248D8115|nr:adhesin [Cryptobacterium curtum]
MKDFTINSCARANAQAQNALSIERARKRTTLPAKVVAVALTATLALGSTPALVYAATTQADATTTASSTSTTSSAPGAGDVPPSMPSDGAQGAGAPPSGGGGADTMSFDYTGSYTGTLTADGTAVTSSGESIAVTDADVNAALAENGGALTLEGSTLSKSGDDTNGDNCNFYGLNSVLLSVGEGSTAYASNVNLSATSEGSNGIFATDSGTVYASGGSISTTAGNSRGLDATYDGTIVADGIDITTQGDHSAGIATDRGGGNISANDMTISTAGSGSPVLYSTGDIEVDNVKGSASGSQIAGMEGLNSIMISNSTLSSTITKATASDPVADGVIIYQSTSGDAESTTGERALFQATDSTLSSAIESGAMFYVTNTSADVVLSNTTLDFDSSAANLLLAAGNDSNNWGSAGSNGATLNFTGIGETMSGVIQADTISQANVYLLDSTNWTGAASIVDNANATSTKDDNLTINVDATSTWTVTADSTVSNLNVVSGGKVVDTAGKTVSIVDASGTTLVSGDSDITVVVTGSYGTTVETSDASLVRSANIDRGAFDTYFKTGFSQTTGTTTGAPTTTVSADTNAASAQSAFTSDDAGNNPLIAFWNWLASVF